MITDGLWLVQGNNMGRGDCPVNQRKSIYHISISILSLDSMERYPYSILQKSPDKPEIPFENHCDEED